VSGFGQDGDLREALDDRIRDILDEHGTTGRRRGQSLDPAFAGMSG
jgi:hypothetical protein